MIKKIGIGLGVLLLIAIAGLSFFMYGRTIVSPSTILGLSAACGCAVAAVIAITSHENRIVRSLVGFIAGICFSSAIILGINYLGADSTQTHMEPVKITKKYTEQRNVTRRSGRRYIPSGEKRTVYFMEFETTAGRKKSVEINVKRFSRIRTGQQMEVDMTPGILGWPIFTQINSVKRKKD